MSRDFRHDTEAEPNMRTSSPVSELVEALIEWSKPDTGSQDAGVQLVCEQAASTLTALSTHIAALEAQLAEVRAVADILTRNITENGLDNHRMKINGEWHEGPVVDTCRDLLVAVRRSILSALEATQTAPLPDESIAARIFEAGNQIHNVATEHQNNEGLLNRLTEIRDEMWSIAREATPPAPKVTEGEE